MVGASVLPHCDLEHLVLPSLSPGSLPWRGDELTFEPVPLPDLHMPGLPSLASLVAMLLAPPAAGAQYPENQLPNQHSPQGRLEGVLGHQRDDTNAANECTGDRG